MEKQVVLGLIFFFFFEKPAESTSAVIHRTWRLDLYLYFLLAFIFHKRLIIRNFNKSHINEFDVIDE